MNVRHLLLAASLSLIACQGSEAPEKAKPAKPAGEPAPKAKPQAAPAKPAVPPAPEKGAFFVYPQTGSTIFSTMDVSFGITGKSVRPAGEDVADKSSGHHHIIIDGGPVPQGQVVPKDDKHLHYGGGQTSAQVKLAPGGHKLTMQFADGAHLSYGKDWSQTIEVKVVEGGDDRKVSFLAPTDGAELMSPFKVKFGLEGMKVRPAGEDVLDKTTGHHHLIVDGKPIPVGQPVPMNETHIHYGKGQTEAELYLKPGQHTLTMQLADGAHLSYGERLATTITITVK